MGDLELQLINYNNDQNGVFHGYHERNYEIISTDLQPGSYGLSFRTAPCLLFCPFDVILSLALSRNLPHFPNCAAFTFQANIKPVELAGDCYQFMRLPRTMNLVPYLGVAGVVHVSHDWLVPLTGTQWTAAESILISVNRTSLLRIWTEPHIIDVDFYLYEQGNPRYRLFCR
jgi:hypothetical protein